MNSDADSTAREREGPHPGYLLGAGSGKELFAFAFISVLSGVFKGLYVSFHNLEVIQNDNPTTQLHKKRWLNVSVMREQGPHLG